MRRRLSAGLTLVAYLLTAFGVPLPAGTAVTAAACGCASTEECRSGGCCCSRPAQRPAKKAAVSRCTGAPGCTNPCCRHGRTSETCFHGTPEQPANDAQPAEAGDDAPASSVTWVSGIAAMKCKGQSTLWVGTGTVFPPPAPQADRPVLDPVGWIRCANEIAHVARPAPPDPPPRAS